MLPVRVGVDLTPYRRTPICPGALQAPAAATGPLAHCMGHQGAQRPPSKEPPLHVFGDADRSDHRIGNYNYSPPGALFRLMSADQKQQRFGHFTITIRPMGRGVAERRGLVPKLQAAEWLASYHPPPGSAKADGEWRGWSSRSH